jgi:hypothetical protein
VFITLNNHLRRPNSRPGERDNGMIQRRDGGHVFVENRQPILPNIRVDCRRLQAVQAAVLKRLPVLVFPEDWIVTCDPVRSRVRTGPNGPYGTLDCVRLIMGIARIWSCDHWRPPETVKVTSNECCDDVGWRAYLRTSQRNHDRPPLDGSFVHSANGFRCKLVAGGFFFVETLFL